MKPTLVLSSRNQWQRMAGKTDNLELVLALAAGCSVKEAADRAGLSERTAYRRLEDHAFRQQITTARNSMFDQAVGKLAVSCAEAIETLVDLLGSTSPTARLGAARAILEHGPRLRDQCELESRIAALETSTCDN